MSMSTYRQQLDRFGLMSLLKCPNIPDYHLMIGSAEDLDSKPVMVYEKSKIPSELVNSYQTIQKNSSEDIEQMIANNSLEVNDLNWNVALIGSGLGV